MRTKKKQLKENIRYCIDELNLEDESVGEVLRAAEKLGVSCQYFVEEFVVGGNENIHSDDYLRIPNFDD